MRTSTAGLDLIKSFEGLELMPYKCPAGVWTVGWGHTGPDVKPGKAITEERAEALLRKDLEKFETAVSLNITVPLNQQQFDALVSFTYNCGAGALAESTLRKRLNKGEDPNKVAKEELPKWVKANGKTLPGLVSRRKKEVELFTSGTPVVKLEKIDITSNHYTHLKKLPIQSHKLSHNQKVTIQADRTYKGVEILERKENHTKINLPWGAGIWWAFNDHWHGLGGQAPKPNQVPIVAYDGVLLNVPYQSQRDNYRDAGRTCFSSACAMAAMYLRPDSVANDNEYLKKVFAIGDSTEVATQVKVLTSLGIKTIFKQTGTLENLKRKLDANIPCPVGILHKGPANKPEGFGHWICVIGYQSEKKKFIVHDPWGELDNYTGTYKSTDGASVLYSENLFMRRWMVEGNRTGWWLDLQ